MTGRDRSFRRAAGIAVSALGLAVAALAVIPGPAVAAPPPFRPPAVESRVLPNGLRVFVLPVRGSGLVHVQVRLPAGADADPVGREGLSALTAWLLAAGTTVRTTERLDEDLTRLGTTVDAVSGPEYATVSGTFLARDAAEGVGIVSDLVLRPLFPEEQVRGVLRNALVGLQRRDPAAVASEQIWSAALPGDPAGRPLRGTPESLRRIQREDLRAFHRDRYRPQGAALAIAGDLAPEQGFALAEEWLGGWSGRPAAPPVVEASGAAPVRIVARGGDGPCELRMAFPVPGRSAPDRAAREFAAALFERELSSRRPGWSPALRLTRDRGFWELAAVVPVDSVAATARAMKEAVSDFIGRPRSAAAVRDGIRLARALLPMMYETLEQRATRRLLADFNGDTGSAFGSFAEAVDRLGPAEVTAAAARGLDLDHPLLAAVGPPEPLRRALASFGSVEVVLPPGSDPTRALEVASPEAVGRGRELIAQALAAHGGEPQLRGVREAVIESELEVSLGDRTARGRLRQVRKEPDRMKLVTSIDRLETRQVLNGSRAWMLLPGDSALRVADSTEVEALRSIYRADPLRLLVAAADSGARVAARGIEPLDGRDVERVDVAFADGGVRRLFFDPESHRLAGHETVTAVPAVWTLADYRLVQGVWWPHDERRRLGSEPYMHLRTLSIQFNPGVRDDEFVAPARVPKR